MTAVQLNAADFLTWPGLSDLPGPGRIDHAFPQRRLSGLSGYAQSLRQRVFALMSGQPAFQQIQHDAEVPGSEAPAGDLRSDRELALRVQNGGSGAFVELVRRYQTALLRYLLARLGNRADAEDALQETFAAAFRYFHSYDPSRPLAGWLYTIARREAGRVARSRPASAARETAAPALDEIDDGDALRLWNRIAESLSESAFTLVWLYYHEGWSQAEIAASLRRPVTWIKVNLHRARSRLARDLGEEYS